MKDTQLYAQILGVQTPWQVTVVDLSLEAGRVEVSVAYADQQGACPACGQSCALYDHAPERRWRHLDTCQLQTFLVSAVPRVQCPDHGVKTLAVPWAEPRGRFTLLFEQLAIGLLQASRHQGKTAQWLRLSPDQVHHVLERAVARGLARRQETAPVERVGIDEKSHRRGHRYGTILTDLDAGRVLEVTADRNTESAEKVLEQGLSEAQRPTVKVVCMDMWEPYAQAVGSRLPKAAIVHDRFHLMGYLTEAVDRTRRAEQRQLPPAARAAVKGSRYLFLRNLENLTVAQFTRFQRAEAAATLTAEAWRHKELFRGFFECDELTSAKHFLIHWANGIDATRTPAMAKVAQTFLSHAGGILNYVTHRITNALAERINGRIQELKSIARGFRRFDSFRLNILFHYGALDMNPLKTR